MASNDWLLRLADLAADQGGLLTTAQAKTVWVSPKQIARLARSGRTATVSPPPHHA